MKIDGIMISAEYQDILASNSVASGRISLQVIPTLLDIAGMCRLLRLSTVQEASPDINCGGDLKPVFKNDMTKMTCLSHKTPF